jgi:hypothetical protein
VAGQQDAASLGTQLPQQVAHRAAGRDVEPVGRLVEHDVVRPVDERAAERHLHLLAPREAARAAVDEILHPQRRDQLFDPRFELRAGDAVQRPRIAQMLTRGEPRVEGADVGEHAETAPGCQRIALRIDAVDQDRTVRRPQHGAD